MNRIDGTAGDDRIIGTAGADDIDGGDGRDRLNGGDGNDIVSGGAGNDYVYGDGGDDTLFGGDGDDALVGHSGRDVIYGEAGNDGVFGGGNADTIHGGAGTDTLFGDGGDDLIDGGADNDRVFGGSGNDTLVYTAGEGVDELHGNTGIDTVRIVMTSADLDSARADLADFSDWLENQLASAGGETAHARQNAGDTYSFTNLGLAVSSIERVELVVDGETVDVDSVLNQAPVAPASQDLSAVEDLSVSGTVGASDPDGDTLTCTMSGGPANGVVQLDAATGDFTYTPNGDFSGSDSFSIMIEDGRGGATEHVVNVSVDAVADMPTLVAAVGEVVGSNIDGSGGTDIIIRTAGGDTIDGGSGHDIIFGDPAAGGSLTIALEISANANDADNSESLAIRIDGAPVDAELSAGTNLGNGSWQLAEADLANLTITLPSPQDVTLQVTATSSEPNGSTQSVSQDLFLEVPTVGGDDIIEGGAGNDFINGGSGVDTASYAGASSGVSVDLAKGRSSGGAGKDFLINIENIAGSAHNDTLTGDEFANVISGGAGNDTLRGGRGADTLTGGEGSDTFVFDDKDVTSGKNHFGVDRITDFGAGDRLDFEDLLKGVKYDDLSNVIRLTTTEEGTLLSIDIKGYSGFADVVMLEGVFDLDLDYLDGSGQLIV